MSLFKHPHLTRGIVKTQTGAYVITRGLVEVPDDIGTALGWTPVNDENEEIAHSPRPRAETAKRDASPVS